jgi:hypothetical protein
MSDYKTQQNGELGESRSKAVLLEDFWVLTRSIDADAADLIVQNKFTDAEAMRDSRNQPMKVASIQAKFFEGANQVNISRDYVYDNDGEPRRGFLVFLHTRDAKRKPVHYLFNAREIVGKWEKTANEKEFFFSLRAGRTYDNFKDLDPDDVRDKVQQAIDEGSFRSLAWAWAKSASVYSSVRDPDCINPKYRLIKIEKAAIAIFYGSGNSIPHAIEPRKDMYNYFGTYEWGYRGEGPSLLAASILTHFLCGRRPNKLEIDRFVEFYLQEIKADDITFGKQEIIGAFAAIPTYINLELEDEAPSREAYEETAKQYAGYFTDKNALIQTWSRVAITQEESVKSGESGSDASL